MTLDDRIIKLEEDLELLEKKNKKPYSSKTYTTGDPQLNIDHFNKMLSGKEENTHTDGYLNGTFKGPEAASPDGASCVTDASSGIGESLDLNETVASSMPVIPLSETQIVDFVNKNLTTNPTNPKIFKLGYIKEFSNEIPAKLRGGRGSAGEPLVRIFKCTEYSAIYTGIAWLHTDKTMAADWVLGGTRHTGEKTGFKFTSGIANAIGTYADGSKALQVYIDDRSVQKVKFLISIDDSDLAEIARTDLLKYLTPAAAAKLLAPAVSIAGTDASGDTVYERPINRLKLANIYMIGDIGPTIM